MFLNCGVGEDSWESLGLQGDPTSPFWRRSVLAVHWKDGCWSWISNTLATWCEELTHLKRPWCWERLKVGGEGDNRGWDDWMASLTQSTWVWVNSRSWWWTGRPGVLQFMGCKESDTTEWLNWTELNYILRPQTDQNLRNDDIDLFWAFWIQATKAWTLATFTSILCWILFCSSFSVTMLTPPNPLHRYARTFSLKLPQYHSSEDCFGKDPQGSPYLLQVISPSFSCSLAWLCLLAQHVSRSEPSIQVTATH